jgi:ferredoxin-NADP reductase
MVMVAVGSGMAPIRSMLHHLVARDNRRRVTFFYGARTDHDLFLLDELLELERAHPWFRFVPTLSRPERNAAAWAGATGRVTDVLARQMGTLRGHEAYLCGPAPMIDATIEVLLTLACKRRHIFFDRFVPTGPDDPDLPFHGERHVLLQHVGRVTGGEGLRVEQGSRPLLAERYVRVSGQPRQHGHDREALDQRQRDQDQPNRSQQDG